MFLKFFDPHPALKEIVNNIMIHKVCLQPSEATYQFSIPPLPEQGLLFYARDEASVENMSTNESKLEPHAIVTGPQLHRVQVQPGRNHLLIKVGFHPGGLYRFLGIPMHEFLHQGAVDAVELLGEDMSIVNAQLRELESVSDMKLLVENFLISRMHKIKKPLPIDHVFSQLIREKGLLKIDKLASDACLSTRQFERVFRERIGLPPKHFSRLVRFSQAWILKQQQPGMSWTKIAYECGYYDQMHLIKDFNEFACVNPSNIESAFVDSPARESIKLFF